MPCAVSYRSPKLSVFPLQVFEALALRRGQAPPETLVTFDLTQPTAKGPASTASLGRDGANDLPLGWVLIPVCQRHAYRPFPYLWEISDLLDPYSIFSSNGVSSHPGTVQKTTA